MWIGKDTIYISLNIGFSEFCCNFFVIHNRVLLSVCIEQVQVALIIAIIQKSSTNVKAKRRTSDCGLGGNHLGQYGRPAAHGPDQRMTVPSQAERG